MHPLWKRQIEFEDFIKDTVSKKPSSFIALYSNVVLVESYFEFITSMLLNKRSKSQEKRIKKLFDKGIISQGDREIFDAIRQLRNKIVHDIRYEPDIAKLRELVQKVNPKNPLDPADEVRCREAEPLRRRFSDEIVRAYAKISNKYKQKVDQAIEDYLKKSVTK